MQHTEKDGDFSHAVLHPVVAPHDHHGKGSVSVHLKEEQSLSLLLLYFVSSSFDGMSAQKTNKIDATVNTVTGGHSNLSILT